MDKCFIEFNQRQVRKERAARRRGSFIWALAALAVLGYMVWFGVAVELYLP
jgi:hypothetical protein